MDNGSKTLILANQAKLPKMIAPGTPLREILGALALTIEQALPNIVCGICVFDRSKTEVEFSIGPELPAAYRDALKGFSFADPPLAPCATVAREGIVVVVADIDAMSAGL
jgi:hypothetical protein